jgi:hypothetical protein
MIRRNCAKVKLTAQDFSRAIECGKDLGQKKRWLDESKAAQAWCLFAEGAANATFENVSVPAGINFASENLNLNLTIEDRALMAVNAWGSILQHGSECCTQPQVPYCEKVSWSPTTLILVAPICILLIGMLLSSLIRNSCHAVSVDASCTTEDKEEDTSALESATRELRQVGSHESTMRGKLLKQLTECWLRNSCLRVLPHADTFAGSAASSFAMLQETFGFQSDSARNQFEHLMSMWRSHCALAADRFIEQGERVNEQVLLRDALLSLHEELLEGFSRWRDKFISYDCFLHRKAGEFPKLGGAPRRAQWSTLKRQVYSGTDVADNAAEEISVKLAEVATYLLVWGEAGNLRFMPEVLYFIVQMLLDAEDQGRRFPTSTQGLAFGTAHRSGAFLATVVRPLYNVVFSEWYERMDVDPKTSKDRKFLHTGYEAYLPADVANYDDWNELFCEPAKLTERLILSNGAPLFSLHPAKRLEAFSHIDWKQSFRASRMKTHRELHSLWGVFAATHRIWLLHAVLFLCGVCSVSDSEAQYQVQGFPFDWNRFASVGLLVPVHAALYSFARWQVTGHSYRRQRHRSMCFWYSIIRRLSWIAPLITYIATCIAPNLLIGRTRTLFLAVVWPMHYSLSILGLVTLLLVPNPEGNLWQPTQVSLRDRFVRYVFWLSVLTVKFMLGLIGITAIYSIIRQLKLTAVGAETPHDFYNTVRSIAKSPGNLLLWVMMWGTCFLFYITDAIVFCHSICALRDCNHICETRFQGRSCLHARRRSRKDPRTIHEKSLAVCTRGSWRVADTQASEGSKHKVPASVGPDRRIYAL